MNTIELENLSKSFKNSLDGENIDMESLRKNMAETIKRMEPVEKSLNSISKPSSHFSLWNLFKYSLILVIIFILALNLYTFFNYKKDALTYFFGDIFDVQNNNVDTDDDDDDDDDKNNPLPKNDSVDGTVHTAVDIAAKNDSNETNENPDEVNKVIDNDKHNYDEDVEAQKNYKANNISLNVNKKSGFCYLGEDRGVRSCVDVTEEDTCLSGEVFPTKDLCVNPNLKE
tara:strand:- start:22817 stop:23500 length:684 start_codon:yes stop_codon:yes gene_type:complete